MRPLLGSSLSGTLAALLIGSAAGTVALQIAFQDADWLLPAQLGLIWVLFAGLGVVFSARLDRQGRQRLWLALGPGLALLGLGIVITDYALFFGGGGLGWMVTSQIVTRKRARMEYQAAIRLMRHGQYDDAVAIMDKLIDVEPDRIEHYRFRAELYRLAGNLRRAAADYERIAQMNPDSTVGYTGLAEVNAQQGNFEVARQYAQSALEREPQRWMWRYNLGMIEDRLGHAESAIQQLEAALAAGIPHSRYQLLTRLWLARNHYRLGHSEQAQAQIKHMRQQTSGLREWQTIFKSDEAAALRGLLVADVTLAGQLMKSGASLNSLDEGG